MQPVRFAIIGCGEIAKKQTIKAMNQVSTAVLVATMDTRLELAEDLA